MLDGSLFKESSILSNDSLTLILKSLYGSKFVSDKSRSEYNKAKDAYLSQKQSKYKPAKY